MRSLNILVVDDQSSMCDVLKAMLEEAGHGVMCAPGGRQALLLLNAQRFDLMIADILMPDYDGIELITEMKKRQLQVPVIAMSGGGHAVPSYYLDMAKRLGAAAALHKPFNRAELFAAVATADASSRGI